MKQLFLFSLMVAFFGAGCAFAPVKPVSVKPELSIEKSIVGKNQEVCIKVVDERPSKTLGTRGVRNVGAEITVEKDLPLALYNSLAEGLHQEGFRPVKSLTSTDHELRVEIRNLDYDMIMGFWSGTLKTDCGLKAYCIIGNSRPYEKLYRGEHKESVQIIQSEEANQRYINLAISSALNALLQDNQLMQCLASPQ